MVVEVHTPTNQDYEAEDDYNTDYHVENFLLERLAW
jgi:hypothetical protein